MVCFVSDSVDALDPSAFDARHASGGPRNRSFPRTTMIEAPSYRCATGTFPLRELARGLHGNVALRALLAGSFPAQCTLMDFRGIRSISTVIDGAIGS